MGPITQTNSSTCRILASRLIGVSGICLMLSAAASKEWKVVSMGPFIQNGIGILWGHWESRNSSHESCQDSRGISWSCWAARDRCFLKMQKTPALYQLLFTGDHCTNMKTSAVGSRFGVKSAPTKQPALTRQDPLTTGSVLQRNSWMEKWTWSAAHRAALAWWEGW